MSKLISDFELNKLTSNVTFTDSTEYNKYRALHYADRIECGPKDYKKTYDIKQLVDITGPNRFHTKTEILYDDGALKKPFFDLDHKTDKPITKYLIKKKFGEAKNAITGVFQTFDCEFDFDKDVIWSSRHGPKQVSFHFFVVNRIGIELNDLYHLVNETHCLYTVFDTKVYASGRKFCMLYGHKFLHDQRQKIPGKWNGKPEEFVIQYMEPMTYSRVLKYTPPHCLDVDVNGKQIKRSCLEMINIKPYEIPDKMNYNFDKYDIEANMKRLPNNKEFENFELYLALCFALHEVVELQQTSLREDEVCALFHRFSMSHRNYNTEAVQKIWDSCNHTKYNIGIRYIHKLLEKMYPGFWQEYAEKSEFVKNHKYIDSAQYKVKYDKEYCNETMNAYPLEKPLCVIKAAMGTGKTEALHNMLNTLHPETSICVISYNIVLCKKYHSMFQDLGFEIYNDLPKGKIESKRIIICLDSLARLQHNTMFDYVITDEALSVLEHMDSDVMKDPSTVSNVLSKIYIESKYLYFIDAYADSLMVYDTIKWLEFQKKEKCYWIHNTYIRETNRKVIKVDDADENDFIEHVCNAIKKGKRVVCPVSSKALAEKLYDNVSSRFPTKVIKRYDSESSRYELYTDSMDPNTHWANVDLLIYTPTIGAGVSFELKHFHLLISYFESSMHHASVSTCNSSCFECAN